MSVDRDGVAPRLVLFDFDGVLVAGDSFAGWLRREGFRPLHRRLLALLAAPVGLPLLRWNRTLPWAARMFLNVAVYAATPALLRSSLEEYGRALARRPERIIADGLDALRAHQAAGDRVVVVSGTETSLLEALLRELGVAGVEVVASRLDFDGPSVRVVRHCFGAAKLSALRAAGIESPWAVAYSDSANDLPMLDGATDAVCVNWRPSERRLATAALGARARFVAWR